MKDGDSVSVFPTPFVAESVKDGDSVSVFPTRFVTESEKYGDSVTDFPVVLDTESENDVISGVSVCVNPWDGVAKSTKLMVGSVIVGLNPWETAIESVKYGTSIAVPCLFTPDKETIGVTLCGGVDLTLAH